MPLQTILVVEDDPNILDVVRRYLERENYRVLTARDGHSALATLDKAQPHLLILDLLLPQLDGVLVARKVRELGDTPIIMLTAKGEEADKIAGLQAGADDYVTKPFSVQELMLRVKAVLRRSTTQAFANGDRPVSVGEVFVDPRTRTARIGERDVELTAKEFDLLYFLARHPRQVFTRSQLLDQVWGFEYYGDPSTVTVHIRRLREKIEPDPAQPTFVQTVWGVGYRFEA